MLNCEMKKESSPAAIHVRSKRENKAGPEAHLQAVCPPLLALQHVE
jgi:hypothetical protein